MRPILTASQLALLAALTSFARAAWSRDADAFYPTLPDVPVAPPAPPRPPAAEPPYAPFGSPGQVVLGDGTSISATSTQYSGSAASELALSFSPSFDVFLFRNLSIGLRATLSFSDSVGYAADSSLLRTHSTTVAIGPVFGANVPLGTNFSLWPRLTLAVESVHQDQSVASATTQAASSEVAPSSTRAGPSVDLYLPLLFHATPHLFIGAGPYVFHDFGRTQGNPNIGGERTTVGGSLFVGGYFGGAAASGPVPRSPASVRPFGEAGQVVIVSDDVLSGSYTAYEGGPTFVSSLGLSVGVDYFVFDNVSIGGVVTAEYTNQVVATTGGSTKVSHEGLVLGPRLGVNVPMSQELSLYPLVTLAAGPSRYDETSGGNADDYDRIQVTVSIYAPLLVHPVSHFFVGLGPFLTHDLLGDISFPDGSTATNRATTWGVSFTIGGWL